MPHGAPPQSELGADITSFRALVTRFEPALVAQMPHCRAGQLAIAGMLTAGSSLKGARWFPGQVAARWTTHSSFRSSRIAAPCRATAGAADVAGTKSYLPSRCALDCV